MPVIAKSHVFPLPPEGLQCCATSYTSSRTEHHSVRDGLTLIFTHGLGGHKEQWDLTISKLLDLDTNSGQNGICEIWAVDFPNHGEAAVVNRPALSTRKSICSTMDYGIMLRHFLSSSHVSGRRLVGIAHSGSATAWVLASRNYKLPLEGMILVEPTLILPPLSPEDPRVVRGIANEKGVVARRDRWSSRDELASYLSVRHPWRKWDSRIFQIYLDHAFMTVETDDGASYVTPKLSKKEEAPLYLAECHSMPGSELAAICAQMPVHTIFAEYPEFISPTAKAQICDASEGRKMASIRTIKGAGHLVPQEKPVELAVMLCDILQLFMSLQMKAVL
ncbi:hypothetical protein SERLA73DRAFT_178461 [Serpula lacrymans var. lacrymans S7.3]|uniref:AB hydrolase-1 domain-containing protein n=2 Tax=Serpula lacrymans var. lacrymans TaxID=341189 RepID=F8PRP1_SERL3|nr:uncharacterized protein SERLADRAFT_462918 [Serpula lacrymans var. lacrymans S7.9]EGO00611.1 hypothetical protein SERLA73DRAFT_178461 [Serpula lacrymans var. lacrymans S7.3]EGO26167.1 hypothetical protein SERLADRAFT_462918 [Serpula lacrymans var. lacrymans S7.9]